MKTLLFSLLFSTVLSSTVFAQDTLLIAHDNTPIKHAIGFALGSSTGYGLSYRYQPNKWGIQINFAPYKAKNESNYNMGITLQYTLSTFRSTRLFLYQANSWNYHYIKDAGFTNYWNSQAPSTTTTYELSNAVGAGIDISLADRISLNLMTGYGAYQNFQEFNLSGEMALFYKF